MDKVVCTNTGMSCECAQCADDTLQMMTGCRFGTPEHCDHDDCSLVYEDCEFCPKGVMK